MTWPARHIALSIDRPPHVVAAFAGDPAKLPLWAAGLSAGIREENGRWLADSPMGDVEVRYTGDVASGILDHDVTLPDGAVVHNPMRVVPNGSGSEILFTLFRREGMSDEEMADDAAVVAEDLRRLRALVEASA